MKRKEPFFRRENRRKDKHKNDNYKRNKCKSTLIDCGAAKRWILLVGNILAAWVILTLADAAASEIAYGVVYLKWDSLILTTCLYSFLDIVFVVCSVRLYTRYILKMTADELYMGTCALRRNARWYAGAILLPLFLLLFCILFTDGSFHRESLAVAELVYAICWSVSGAFMRGFTDGILFRSLILGSMKNKWSFVETILISGILFTVFHFGFPTESFDAEKVILMAATLMIMGMAFTAITCATGTIWASVAMYFTYSMLYGKTYILNIDTVRDEKAIWNYTLKSENWLIAGFSGTDGVKISFMVLLAFLAVFAAALLQIRHSESGSITHRNSGREEL